MTAAAAPPARTTKTVTIVQRRLPYYRVPLFERLREELARRDVTLRLAYGDPTAEELSKKDSGELAWAEHVPCHYAMGGRLCWQNAAREMRGSDLVVMTPENRLLFNLWAQFAQHRVPTALWGHGANLQGKEESLRERFKRWTSAHTDWWFAYTELSVPLIIRTGFPADRITVLDNAVDTGELRALRQSVTPGDVQRFLRDHGLKGTHMGVCVGSLYAEKRVDFLLDAARRIRERVPDFELVVIGAGPQRELVEEFCARHSWASYLGVRTGREKVEAITASRVMLNPGLVGLGILDSFACGVPMVTTDCGLHSPEIVYLSHGENGLMTGNQPEHFSSVVSGLLLDDALSQRLQLGCVASAKRYSIENMAQRFSDGIMRALNAGRMNRKRG